ncbi:hypothetical protein DBR24_18420 [Pseudomonas sp. HMWF006]|nr:hypothetical protein DBR24_18420 [Pseudomonas sp. HMWF006]PTT62157.1 hypothetical protein DBR26_25090 [Pseudomonas sp. HMWF007]PTT92613.1 hypothetical protein DBR29_08825 [Pseudomonas sp. HMWF005]
MRLQIPVGAGLLAKAVCHSTAMLTDPMPSRASPLPQGFPVFERLISMRWHALIKCRKVRRG